MPLAPDEVRVLSNFYNNKYAKEFHRAQRMADKARKLGKPSFVKELMRRGVGGAVGLSAAALSVAGISKLLEPSQKRSFKRMLREEPNFTKDKEKAQKIHKLLHKLNPNAASDPLMSKAFVNKGLALGDAALDPQVLQNLMVDRSTDRKSYLDAFKSIKSIE